jgi:hypothetical protein
MTDAPNVTYWNWFYACRGHQSPRFPFTWEGCWRSMFTLARMEKLYD